MITEYISTLAENAARCPCEIWHSAGNPEAADEEFDSDIKSRLKNLRQ